MGVFTSLDVVVSVQTGCGEKDPACYLQGQCCYIRPLILLCQPLLLTAVTCSQYSGGEYMYRYVHEDCERTAAALTIWRPLGLFGV